MTRRSNPRLDSVRGSPYRILGAIHRGGMGEVLLASAEGAHGFRRRVVLKGLLPELVEDEVSLDLFRREAMIMSRLDHPNIVRVIDFVFVDGQPFLAMEYVRGRNFQQVIQRASRVGERVPLGVALAVVGGVLRGLHHAHEAMDPDGQPLHVVHRDVSPGNVLLSYFGEVKVTDFGIALAEGERRHTEKAGIRGKARYLAPERVVGQPASPRSDVFAAGAVLAEALTGSALFDRKGLNATLLAILRADRQSLIDGVFADAGEVPGLRGVLSGALAKRPEDRFGSALQMAEAIAGVERASGGAMTSHELGSHLRSMFPEADAGERSLSLFASAESLEPRTVLESEFPSESWRQRISTPPSAPERARSIQEVDPPRPASRCFDVDAYLLETYAKVSPSELKVSPIERSRGPVWNAEAALAEPLARRPTIPDGDPVDQEAPLLDPTGAFGRLGRLKLMGLGLVTLGALLVLAVWSLKPPSPLSDPAPRAKEETRTLEPIVIVRPTSSSRPEVSDE